MDVCFFPANNFVSITHQGKHNTFTSRVDETKPVNEYILETAKDFLGLNENHMAASPNLVFDPPSILTMKVS